MIEITSKNASEFRRASTWEGRDGEVVTYEGIAAPFESIKNICTELKGSELEATLGFFLALNGTGIIISKENAKAAAAIATENGMTGDEFAHRFSLCGGLQMPTNGTMMTEAMLRDMFATSTRFRNGRTPQVLPQMAAVCDVYGVEPSLMFEKFNIRTYQSLSSLGLPKGEVVLCATLLSPAEISGISGSFERASMVSHLLGMRKKHASEVAHFIASHPHTDMSLLRRLSDHPEKYEVKKDTTVESLLSQSIENKAKKEVKKVEKAYKKAGFKLKDCKCLLRDAPITSGKYSVRILDADDPMQVMLGYATDCCQRLGDAGETSMMYGLTNEHAGFWVLENKQTKKVYAQAEVWEAGSDTLVLDNIEFANDAEIDQYVEPISKYLLSSPYKNILMGCGYNGLSYEAQGQLERALEVVPTVTPYDIFVMSYEEDMWVDNSKDESKVTEIPSVEKAAELLESGYVTYYDYLYSDVDDNKGIVYLKKDFEVSPFFGVSKDEQDMAASKNKFEKFFSHMSSERFDGILKYVSAFSGIDREDEQEEDSCKG